MQKVLILLVLFLSGCQSVRDRSVILTSKAENGTSICNGVIYNTNYVISARHCLDNIDYKIFKHSRSALKVDLVWASKKRDLCIFKIRNPHEKYKPLKFSKTAIKVLIFNPYRLKYTEGRFVKLSDIWNLKNIYIVDMLIDKGQSGAGAFNENDEIIGIVTHYDIVTKKTIVTPIQEAIEKIKEIENE